MTPLFINFFTADYAEAASKLKASLDRHHLEHLILPAEDRGSWVANCAQKPVFIAEQRRRFPGRPVVWLDADCEVLREPTLFLGMAAAVSDIDLAVCRWQPPASTRMPEVLSGTVYVGDTEPARAILKAWERLSSDHPDAWDQRTLQAAIEEVPAANVLWLPVEYTFVFDTHRSQYPDADPVIQHYQHSRRHRGKRRAR